MPSFDRSTGKKYPYTRVVLKELPKLPWRQAKVFKAYLAYTGLDTEWGRLSLGSVGLMQVPSKPFALRRIPSVVVTDRMRGYAHYDGSDTIQLRKLFVEQYEALVSDLHREPEDTIEEIEPPRTIRGNARLLMESKILHEMVHWARTMVTLLPDLNDDYGDRFERRAYGRIPTHTGLGLSDYIDVPGNR